MNRVTRERYESWKQGSFFDETIHSELEALDPERDAAEIEDRFYRDLEFSTESYGLLGTMTVY